MKYIFGFAMLFGSIWPFMGNIMLKLKRDNVIELSNIVWHWIVPVSNFGIYFVLVFLIFKILRIENIQLNNNGLILFNTGLIVTTAIWVLGIIKVYIVPLERILYSFPSKNILVVSTLLIFLGVLQFLLETQKRKAHNV